MEKNVLLIGGAGFIGSRVLSRGLAAGHRITLLDRRSAFSSVENPSENLRAIVGDISDFKNLAALFTEFDVIINLAGVLGTSETIDAPLPSVHTNVVGALNVFESHRLSKTHRPDQRCVQITVGNYFMNNTYSITKSCTERFALMYNAEHQTKIAVVRALNAYGPGQKRYPVRKIIPTFVLAALERRPIPIFGSGNQVMDMIYVDDVADILLKAATAENLSYGKVFEAGTGRRTTVNDVAKLVLKYTSSDAGTQYLPMRRGEPLDSVVLGDPTTLSPLNMTPNAFVQLEEGLQTTIRWYQNRQLSMEDQGEVR